VNVSEPNLKSPHNTLWQMVELRAALTPGRVIFVDDHERSITFDGFKARAERVAQGLLDLGVEPGSTVSWQLPSRIETLLLKTALSRLDVLQVPLLPVYREREVGFLLKETQPAFLFLPGVLKGFDHVAMAEKLTSDMPRKPRIALAYDSLPEAEVRALPPAPTDNGNERWIFATSGTTSEPKGVVHSDRSMLAAALALGERLCYSADDVSTVNFPVAHGGGLTVLMNMLAYGMKGVITETFQPATAMPLYKRHGVTLGGTGTAFYLGFLNEQRRQPGEKIIPTLRLMHGGGAPKPPALYFQVKQELGVKIAHGYGMTEGLLLAQCPPDDSDEQLANSDGLPAQGVQFRILRADGTLANVGEDGEVLVRGPMLFKRYTRADLTAKAFDADGYYRTGDFGHLRPDGRIALSGRLKDIIIRKGENISAADIENVLHQHPRVAEVAVIGLPDEARGERACAVVVTRGAERISFADMTAACEQAGLARFKIPEQLEFVDELPRNSTMKVLKTRLREEMARRPWPSR
jgi:acyl-CoA synthetase (AMP-forming)/AMP-acid ligase II